MIENAIVNNNKNNEPIEQPIIDQAMEQGSDQLESSNLNEKGFSHKQHKFFFGIGSFALVLYVAIVLLVSGKSTTVHATEDNVMTVAAPMTAGIGMPEVKTFEERTKTLQVAVTDNDGLPLTSMPNVPAASEGISKRPEVMLTENQAELIRNMSEYFAQIGKYAIVTSGTRSSESQLELIKQRIEEKGVSQKFPSLETAEMKDTSVWLKAWQWLRAKRVPINAPAPVKGASVKISKHLSGRAIDLIGSNLDELKALINKYRASAAAKNTDVKIAGIVREPYCVHIDIKA